MGTLGSQAGSEQGGAVGAVGGAPGSTLAAGALCDKPSLVFKWLDAPGCSCCPQSSLVLRMGFACMKSAFSEAVSDAFGPFHCFTALG